MKPNFKDKRGEIVDVIAGIDIDAVTYITFTKGAVRGNHYHKKTIQYDFILEGKLKLATDEGERMVKEGDLIMHPRTVPHAYKALSASKMLTMTKGPRQGQEYESDTYRLEKPLL